MDEMDRPSCPVSAPRTHQLALPLPPAYHHNVCCDYSVFTANTAEDLQSAEYDMLNRYLDDLCSFLADTRLIQRHPEKFFNYVRGEEWRATATHLDKEVVSHEELAYTLSLCNAFQALFTEDEEQHETPASPSPVMPCPRGTQMAPDSRPSSVMADLREYVQNGPPPVNHRGENASAPGMAQLHRFYQTTKRLMLNRNRSVRNDAARVTLAVPIATAPEEPLLPAAEARRQRILQFVLAFGMSPKKQHEVGIMRGAIADLVSCCRSSASKDAEAPLTVINIGEGKGYVSRAIALCDALQVVGVDCNPAHKERAVERVETLLGSSISLREGEYGRDMVNLLYEARGHVASVVCRLGDEVDWYALLRGHVRTVDDRTGCVEGIDTDELESTGVDAASPRDGAETEVGAAAKLRCKVCGKVVRASNQRLLLKHAHSHLTASKPAIAGEGQSLPPGVPDKAEADRWNLQLSQHRYAERLTAAFYTSIEPGGAAEGTDERVDASAHSGSLLGSTGLHASAHGKRPRPPDIAMAVPCRSGTFCADEMGLSVVHVRRGARVLVRWLARPASPTGNTNTSEANPRGTHEDAAAAAPLAVEAMCTPAPSAPPPAVRTVHDEYLTVTGFDDATGVHVVIADSGRKRETCLLLALADGHAGAADLTADATSEQRERSREWLQQAEERSGQRRCALVLRVLPFSTTLTPVVSVPSMRNTVMIGLHPCGDLGSNVCRLFMESEARGLLLVSCCWHALTNAGFPLSTALRRRGMRTEKISLLLATQPLDMWATASAEGHRSSAKILFFRSLLGLLWARWAAAYADAAPTCRAAGCGFAPQPHLEPTFLRKVTKVKEQLDFAAFVDMVLREYIDSATGKTTAYTWHTEVCQACRAAQEGFLRGEAAAVVLREVSDAYCRSLFSSFLGLTVLRMWMCHLVESVLLLDRTLYLHEAMIAEARTRSSAVSLVPLFDGAISPRMFGIFARRVATS